MLKFLLFCITIRTISSTYFSIMHLNETKEMKTNNTSSGAYDFDTINEQKDRCTYQEMQYCHRYIRSIFLLYTGIGGWVLLGIILTGILLQVHILLRRRNTQGKIKLRRNDLSYELSQLRRNRRNSFQAKWVDEVHRGHNSSP